MDPPTKQTDLQSAFTSLLALHRSPDPRAAAGRHCQWLYACRTARQTDPRRYWNRMLWYIGPALPCQRGRCVVDTGVRKAMLLTAGVGCVHGCLTQLSATSSHRVSKSLTSCKHMSVSPSHMEHACQRTTQQQHDRPLLLGFGWMRSTSKLSELRDARFTLRPGGLVSPLVLLHSRPSRLLARG